MTSITIIGWYGTETIGDRAILSGLINTFSKIYSNFEIRLGSLYPDFSKRVLIEDIEFHKLISNNKLNKITIFNSMSRSELKSNIVSSDMVAIGGGPLMDIEEMHMLRYAFRYAKRKYITTAILGCGWGPLRNSEYINCAIDIVNLADIVIFRDTQSLNQCKAVLPSVKASAAIDPACFCAEFFRQQASASEQSHISVNFRDAALDQYDADAEKYENYLLDITKRLLEESPEKDIHFVPMHTFCIGGDDRDILNRIAFKLQSSKIKVLNNPPSLQEVMNDYHNASICIGMRFHAVLLQTILNGRNYIIDYTDPQKGKIISLLEQTGTASQYQGRYYSLISSKGNLNDFSSSINCVHIPDNLISNFQTLYISNIQQARENTAC